MSGIVTKLEAIDAMCAQTAAAVDHTYGRVILHGIAPTTLDFSDRPERVVGHRDTAAFVLPTGRESYAPVGQAGCCSMHGGT
jgi:hypothetical protein